MNQIQHSIMQYIKTGCVYFSFYIIHFNLIQFLVFVCHRSASALLHPGCENLLEFSWYDAQMVSWAISIHSSCQFGSTCQESQSKGIILINYLMMTFKRARCSSRLWKLCTHLLSLCLQSFKSRKNISVLWSKILALSNTSRMPSGTTSLSGIRVRTPETFLRRLQHLTHGLNPTCSVMLSGKGSGRK